jgi:hypothetical protein
MTNAHPLPRSLAEQAPFTTVRIQVERPGIPGVGFGTGFFWTNRIADGGEFSAIITNKHVVGGAHRLTLQLHERDGDSGRIGPGRPVVLEGSSLIVIQHPEPDVDLVLIPMGPAINALDWKPFFRTVDFSMIPRQAEIDELSSIQPIIAIGYPNGVVDMVNNFPISRQGVTAVPPWIDYQGKQEFVCDLAVFGGSSGSPIFVIWDGIRHNRDGAMIVGQSRIILLGVLYAGHILNARGEIVTQEPTIAGPPHVITTQMIHLALCVKACRVEELVRLANATCGLRILTARVSSPRRTPQPPRGPDLV